MRLVGAVDAKPDEWAESPNLEDLRISLRRQRPNLILVAAEAEIPKLKFALSQIQNSSLRDILSNFIGTVPLAKSKSDFNDFELGPSGCLIEQIEKKSQLIDLIEARKSSAKRGDRRESAFKLHIMPVLEHAKRIDVVDRYAFSAITGGKDRQWLLRRIMAGYSFPIRITCALPDENGNDLLNPDQIRRMEGAVEQLFRASSNFEGYFQVDVAQHHKADFHNRRLRASYDSGTVAFSLEKGLDTFSEEPFREENAFGYVESESFNRTQAFLQSQIVQSFKWEKISSSGISRVK